jgi:hypothetical protein
MRFAIFLTAMLLTACGTDPVYLKHSDGRVVQCGPYSTAIAGEAEVALIRERGCIDDYQRQGFLRVPRP